MSDKMIEDMAKDIDYAINNECKLNNGKSCEYCKFDNKGDWNCQNIMVATHLYGEGYRKIPEGSVVLSKEEYERLKRIELEKDRLYEIKLDLENQLIQSGLTEYIGADEIEKQARKETAKEILSYLIESGVINTAPQTIKMYFKENYGVEE